MKSHLVLFISADLLLMAEMLEAQTMTIPLKSRVYETRHAVPRVGKSEPLSSLGINVPLLDYINRTDCQWYSDILVGNPPQALSVLWDTGSIDLLLPQDNCTSCGEHRLFRTAASETFMPTPGTSVTRGFGTGADSIPFTDVQYVTGHVVSDQVAIGSSNLVISDQTFIMCDTYAPALNAMPIDGIAGLFIPNSSSTGSESFFWRLFESGQLAAPIFSFFMPAGEERGAQLTLGGIDHDKYEEGKELIYFPVNRSLALSEDYRGFVYNLAAIYANGQRITFDSASTSVLRESRGEEPPPGIAFLDTGTAFMQAPSYEVARTLYAQVSPSITQIDAAGAWGAPCNELDQVSVDFTLTFSSSGRGGQEYLNVTMPRESFNLGEYPGLPGICQAAWNNRYRPIPSPPEVGPVWFIGSPLLKAYYTVWDGIGMEIGWAKARKVGMRS
ncbi:putative Pepsin B [Seiridium cardinale]|uniref:Pepsin B n=1 Tax=Seiridium cardinale TaxID=138064 RepID=A0ABR2XH82_9PEZI